MDIFEWIMEWQSVTTRRRHANLHPSTSPLSHQPAPHHFPRMKRLAPCSIVDLMSATCSGRTDHGAGARATSCFAFSARFLSYPRILLEWLP